MSLLRVEDLSVETAGGRRLLDRVGFTLERGEILGLVGESGSGKSLTMRAVMRLLPGTGMRIAGGRVALDGEDLAALPETRMRALRGRRIGMIFQNPTSHLDPVMSIGAQIVEAVRTHRPEVSRANARARALTLMEQVGFTDPARQFASYAHEFSGGMRQRAMIAIALACDPEALIADEPTTALDVTVQAQVLNLLKSLRDSRGLAIVLITHDLGVVAQTADRIAVMRHGRILETGPTRQILSAPRDDYTRRLIASHPTARASRPPAPNPQKGLPLIDAQHVAVRYPLPGGGLFGRKRRFEALTDCSLAVWPGEVVGVVGESGSGKSTLARVMLGLQPATEGNVAFRATPVDPFGGPGLAMLRDRAAMIFQDPMNSLNPRLAIGEAIAEVLRVKDRRPAAAIPARVGELLDLVELPREFANRRPASLSGGQCQRAGIARALAVEPELLFADECLAALDVTIQAQIVALLAKLAREMGLAVVFIAHDLSVVRNLCSRVVVMRRGRIVETGDTARVFDAPGTDYTADLLAAIPSIDPDRPLLAGKRNDQRTGMNNQ